ncbi:MAG TPA: ABC transporter ATP-binding protein [Candidatus Nanoarchaeia archaeon]|nr:ABC transporter ATP-binding protein [Candidatus Nanoarchaeia archaeon]
MIETNGLTKKFGDLTAVDNLSLQVNDGEVFGFLGPNGAGKTTTVRMLCCLISKTSGTAKIGDYEVGNRADQQKIRKMVGLLTENVGLYEELSAYDNLDFYGRFYKLDEQKRKEQIEYLLKMLGLWEKRNEAAGIFSKGMKQKLAIARALIHDPQVLFLDEPTASLDPEASRTVRDFILELKKQKRTIFLNTHLLDEAEKICDRVAILKTHLIAIGTPQELRRSLSGRKIKVQVQRVDNAILDAIKKIGFQVSEATDISLVVDVSDPEKENPTILKAIEAAGGHVQFVTEIGSSLEDVYLKLVRG